MLHVWLRNACGIQFLAIGDVDGVIRVFFLATVGTPDTQFHRIDIPGDYPSAISFTPDAGLLVVATSLHKTISFYTIHSKCVHPYRSAVIAASSAVI